MSGSNADLNAENDEKAQSSIDLLRLFWKRRSERWRLHRKATRIRWTVASELANRSCKWSLRYFPAGQLQRYIQTFLKQQWTRHVATEKNYNKCRKSSGHKPHRRRTPVFVIDPPLHSSGIDSKRNPRKPPINAFSCRPTILWPTLEVCTGMGTAVIRRNPRVYRGCGYKCCGNSAGMDLTIAGFPRGCILLRREPRIEPCI